jgi:hypothetical protein
MNDTQTYHLSRQDEVWIAEWIEFGLREMAAYLRRQAAFEDYCRRREGGPITSNRRPIGA